MCLAQEPQRSDAGEARTRGPWVSSQALTNALPSHDCYIRICVIMRCVIRDSTVMLLVPTMRYKLQRLQHFWDHDNLFYIEVV